MSALVKFFPLPVVKGLDSLRVVGDDVILIPGESGWNVFGVFNIDLLRVSSRRVGESYVFSESTARESCDTAVVGNDDTLTIGTPHYIAVLVLVHEDAKTALILVGRDTFLGAVYLIPLVRLPGERREGLVAEKPFQYRDSVASGKAAMTLIAEYLNNLKNVLVNEVLHTFLVLADSL